MRSSPLFRATASVLLLSIGFWTCGCTASKTVATGNLGECQEKPIRILTPGGSEYHLFAWSLRDSSIQAIKGEVHHPSAKPGFWGDRFDPFSGAVPLDSVKQCSCEGTDVARTVIFCCFLGMVGFAAVGAIGMSH